MPQEQLDCRGRCAWARLQQNQGMQRQMREDGKGVAMALEKAQQPQLPVLCLYLS